MSKLRLTGSTSGYTEIQASAVAGDNTLNLPTTAGGTLLATDSSGNVNIDSGTFYVDAANNRVGVGTTSPSATLQAVAASGEATVRVQNSGTASAWFILSPGSSGNAYIHNEGNAPTIFTTNGTERARIDNAGNFLLNTTSNDPAGTNVNGFTIGNSSGSYFSITRDGGSMGSFNRKTNDGTIVEFRQDGTLEGSISVSGTTVSYNGAHLSRWSQLPNGVERTEILRGTVLSNIDEMCAWDEEENEQLNRMKVSDVEGDPNVSGVFQSWDDDDDTYTDDFYCAMTGDFIIRIAEGVTVQRGDLLMSAGDGTAKPQDDDIIRSKTIAKVTSTHVTCTYDDGSYCVPCVLMAC
jgi:hypothetical protein